MKLFYVKISTNQNWNHAACYQEALNAILMHRIRKNKSKVMMLRFFVRQNSSESYLRFSPLCDVFVLQAERLPFTFVLI